MRVERTCESDFTILFMNSGGPKFIVAFGWLNPVVVLAYGHFFYFIFKLIWSWALAHLLLLEMLNYPYFTVRLS